MSEPSYHDGNGRFPTFIAEIKKHYQALEEAIEPIDEKIENLEGDWTLRPVSVFWTPILKELIPPLQQATASCLSLGEVLSNFASSCWARVPLQSDLLRIKKQIEEAGILLTAYVMHYRQRAENYAACVRQLRAQRDLFCALENLSSIVHRTIDNAHAKLVRMTAEGSHE